MTNNGHATISGTEFFTGPTFLSQKLSEKTINPILNGVFWITHTHDWGKIPPARYNLVISKDMDLKFGMI